MRSGCNTGGCHGAARGKDGFRLSLFGFDPDGDHYRLTREISGRRINLAVPAESLLLEKAVGEVPHTGGKRFERRRASYYQTHHPLARGRRAARPADGRHAGRRRALSRRRPCSTARASTQQIVVRAKYSDGTDRDVTSLALFLTNNDTSATIDRATASSPPASAARRSSWPASHTFTVGVPGHRAAEGPASSTWPERAREQLHRHARRRQAQEAAHRAVGASAPTRRSSAASTSTSSACCRRPRSTTASWPTRRRTSARSWSTNCSTARSSPRSG